MEIISSDSGTQFNSTEFHDECQTHGVHFTSAATEHHGMNGQVKVTWRTLWTISQSFMVHAQVLESCIHFVLMYTAYHIFLVLPIKDLISEDGKPTTPFKLATGTNPSVSYLHVLFFPCVVQNLLYMLGKKR